MVPVELFGGTEFAPVQEGGYNLTLGPYGFYWFSLQPQHHDARGRGAGAEELPVVGVAEDWRQLFRRGSRGRPSLSGAWPGFFERNRWYAGRTRVLRRPSCSTPSRWRWGGGTRPPSWPSSRSSTPTVSPRPTSCR